MADPITDPKFPGLVGEVTPTSDGSGWMGTVRRAGSSLHIWQRRIDQDGGWLHAGSRGHAQDCVRSAIRRIGRAAAAREALAKEFPVACPACSAGAGERCRTKHGRPASRTHSSRRAAMVRG